ncbi:CD20-like domain-containing protein [Mangrovibacterium lignilyticum]|uniref:CD20-like domain-containing protein n=1 Tax=Mangrovibacterium lignilyticum TaxID=2668052 RepID=UPI0013D45676|nr:CD20-like domain-containing protein [Mangrovibacterium lignilyticum]
MSKKKRQKVKYPPLWIVFLVILSVFIGILTAVIGINKITNYDHPYWFGFVFGGFGLLVGILAAKRSKRYIAVNRRIKNDYPLAIFYISTGFIGIFLWVGTVMNQSLSQLDKCDNYTIIHKYRQESRSRSPEVNSLIITIDGEEHRLVCSRHYWFNTRIGQQINLCLYKSPIGFDYIVLTNDQ